MPKVIQLDQQSKRDLGFRIPDEMLQNMRRPEKKETPAPAPVRGVQAIPAAPCVPKKKLRVAAYCRVSTLLATQETSIDTQRQHYERKIRENPEWEYAGIYLEAGITGTKAEIRPELKRLLRDCQDGKIDLILTKSISRFARNTSDCLSLVRTLNAQGVNLFFEKENIHTGTMESEFMLSVLAALAQDESSSLSRNVKWGMRKRFEDGTFKHSIRPYGYAKKDGSLIIIPQEAAIVRRIYEEVLSGNGAFTIAKALNAEGIPSPTEKQWTSSTIQDMIRNPVYIGDMLCQKTFSPECRQQVKNKGELDMYYYEDHHEPIIDKDSFERAGKAMEQRGREAGVAAGRRPARSCRYPFTSKLICSECGSTMHRQKTRTGNAWICSRHVQDKESCSNLPVKEETLRRAFVNVLNKLAFSQKQLPQYRVLDVFEKFMAREEPVRDLLQIDKELETVGLELRKLAVLTMMENFLPEHREKKNQLKTEERKLREEKDALLEKQVSDDLEDLRNLVGCWGITESPDAFPEEAFRQVIDYVTVTARKTATFHFTCGLELTEGICEEVIR